MAILSLTDSAQIFNIGKMMIANINIMNIKLMILNKFSDFVYFMVSSYHQIDQPAIERDNRFAK